MKKTTLLIILVALAIKAISQAVVTDPGLTQLAIEEAAERQTIIAKTFEQLSESVKQTTELEKAYNLAKEGYDALVEVNEYLKDLEMIQRAIDRQERLIKRTRDMVNDFGREDIFSVQEYRKITDNMIRIIDGCTDIIDMFDLVIQPGRTKMNDAERFSMIMNIEKKYNENYAVAIDHLEYYQQVYDQREAIRAMSDMAEKMNK